MSRVLIVGAASGLAGALSASLAGAGHEVDGVIRESIPAGSTRFRKTFASITDAEEKYPIVFLLGAYIPECMSEPDHGRLFRDNVDLVYRVVEHFPESKIVFSSSTAVLLGGSGPTDEYGVSKAVGETLVESARDWAIVRLSSIYGPGMRRPNFISRAVDQALGEGVITLYGSGKRCQDYLHYADAAGMLQRAGESDDCRVYLGACGHSYSNREIAETIRFALPDVKIQVVDRPEGQSGRFDSAESWEVLGIRPQIEPEAGIRQLIEEWRSTTG